MKMHLLSDGRLRMRKSIFVPDADNSETIELSVPCALIRHARGNALFDTGCHQTVAEHAEARWGELARLMTPIMSANENVVDGFSGLGLSCDDIDLVVCSHLHPDHCGCNSFFNRATFIMHRKEVEAARAPGAQAQGYLAVPIDMIDGERDVFGDGRMVLLPLPGHTPGTTGALVALDQSGTFFLASDTVSLRTTLDTGVVPKNTWNVDALLKSLAEIRRIEASGAQILCGHDARQWASLRKGIEAYE
jgi:N-acyl homoserine lactone hydrolase